MHASRPRHGHTASEVVSSTRLRPARLARVAAVVHWSGLGRLWRHRFKWAVRLLAALSLVLVLALGGAWWLSRSQPGWWTDSAEARAAAPALARAVEDGSWTVLTQARPGSTVEQRTAPWSMALDDAGATAWLNERFPQWLLNQTTLPAWPQQVGRLGASFDGGVRLGAVIKSGSTERYVSAEVRPRIDERGALWLPAAWISIGRLSLPAGWAAHRAWDELPASLRSAPELRDALAVLSGERPAMADPMMRLPDGRSVRLVGVRVEQGRLVLTCRTMEHP